MLKFGKEPLARPVLTQIAARVANKSKATIKLQMLPQASVIIPLLNINERANILFEVRSRALRRHAGEISFPGGYREPGESAWETARREVAEELNWKVSENSELGAAGLWHNRKSNVAVTPFIVFDEHLQIENVTINRAEVQYCIKVCLDELVLLGDNKKKYRKLHEEWPPVPFFHIDERHTIWGFTGFLLDALLTEIKQIIKPNVD